MNLAAWFGMVLAAGIHEPARNSKVAGIWAADALPGVVRNVVSDGRQFTIVDVIQGDGTTSVTRQQCLLETKKHHEGTGRSASSHIFVMECTGHKEEWTLSNDGSQLTVRSVGSDLSSAPLLVLRQSKTKLK